MTAPPQPAAPAPQSVTVLIDCEECSGSGFASLGADDPCDECRGTGTVWVTTPAPRDAGACRCTFAQRMVGDGCQVCNPALAAEIAAENDADAAGENGGGA